MKKMRKKNSKINEENNIIQKIFKILEIFTHPKIILQFLKINNPIVEKKNFKNKFLLSFRDKNEIKKSLDKKIDKFLRTANRIIGDNENKKFLKNKKELYDYIFEEINFDVKNFENEKKLDNFQKKIKKRLTDSELKNFQEKEKNLGNRKLILEKNNNFVILKLNDFDLNYAFWEWNLDQKKPKLINDREIYLISKCINFLVGLKTNNLKKNNFNSKNQIYFVSDELKITNDNFKKYNIDNFKEKI